MSNEGVSGNLPDDSTPGAEHLFRLMVENVKDYAIFAVDLEGRIVSWNPGVEKLLGYTEEEWVGLDACIIFTQEDNEQGACLREMRDAEEKGRAEDVRWHVRKDGSRFWGNGLMMALRDGEGGLRGFAKIMRDETERKLTQERLRESEARFQRLVELSPDAIVVHSEGKVLFINTAGAKLLGAAGPEQVVGKQVAEFIHPDYHDMLRARLEKLSLGETQPQMEIKFLRLDGTEICGELSSVPFLYQGKVAVQAVIRDLTRRKRAQEALRESERRFRLIFNQQFQFMAILSPEGVLLDVNELPLRAAGTTREQVIGQLFWETPWWSGLPEMQAAWPARLAEAACSDEPVFSVDLYRAADGTRIADASITAVKDEGGRVEFFIVQASDITERKRAEEEREHLLREAQEANRMKDEFLATLSHELRTPMTAILGWSSMLLGGRLDAGTIHQALETIHRNARAQVQLIDDILDVSRIITGKLRLDVRPVDLSEVIEAAVGVVRPAAEAKEIQLRVQIDSTAGLVSGDPSRLQQVIWNLLSNAVKFTPEGGRVEVSLKRADSHAVIAVKDTGHGIRPEMLPHVFERFRQADSSSTRAYSGLGLGLAIVRHLVELHGGTVSAESPGEGRGATFRVELPLTIPLGTQKSETREVGRESSEADDVEGIHCPPELEGLHVLVVDDEEDSRNLLSTVLVNCGARVTTAGSAREALDELKRNKFDVLLSDIGMPGEDGHSLIKKVRRLPEAQGGRIPAAALTAYARSEDRLKALRSGFKMHVPKPVEPAELVTVVANLAGRHESD